jgi:hypothetical protein
MQKAWFRSRLCWLSIAGILFFLGAWITPFVTKEGRHISASWIAPGDFYQGYGINLSFHRMGFWAGRPYAGLGNPGRATWSSNVPIPFERERHSWSVIKGSPIRIGWGPPFAPSADSFRIIFDYWFGATVCLAVFCCSAVSRKRRSRLKSN